MFEEPGISLRTIVKLDLYSLYYFGVNQIAIIQKLLGYISPILG